MQLLAHLYNYWRMIIVWTHFQALCQKSLSSASSIPAPIAYQHQSGVESPCFERQNDELRRRQELWAGHKNWIGIG